jgi:23S rRNA (guanosine2251-2'-O)-methyltransferase
MQEQIIYGRNPVQEAITNNVDIEKIYLNREMTGEYEVSLRNQCNELNIPLSKVPFGKLDFLTKRANHQGVVAVISAVKISTIEEVFSAALEGNEIVVILDGISDVRNVGAIARSAKAFGCKAIITGTKGSASLNMDAVKSSSGALLTIPMIREKNVMIAIEKLQQLGFEVWATDLKATENLHDTTCDGPIAIVLGSEDKGVSREALKVADKKIKFIQENTVDSLNVSVAAGICLYDLYKRRLD